MRILCAVFLLACIQNSFSQVVLLDKCYDLITQGDLKKAEDAVLLAEKNVATANDARTFYLKAFIYKELYTQASVLSQKNQYRGASVKSIKKCAQLDHDNTLKQQLKQLRDYVAASLFNDGTESYNNQNYKTALSYFRQFVELKDSKDNNWLEANYFIGSSYYSLHQVDSAEYFLELVREKNYDEPILFVDLTYLLLEKKSHKALDVVKAGIFKYPNNYDLQIAELNVLSRSQKLDSLLLKIENFLLTHPDNLDVLLMGATTSEKLGEANSDDKPKYFAKAEKNYLKVISIDSMHYDANYNLGVLYYNEAVDIVNKSDLETNVQELNRVLELSTRLFEKSLPLLIKIFNRKSDSRKPDLRLLQALQAIYYNLNMKADLTRINAMIKSLNQ